jgi:hypothetical protein
MTQKNVMDGTWDNSSARSYLHVHGLNKEAIDCIITGDWEHPALWTRGIELFQHIDVPMHLIFLGVLHTCVQMVHGWMTKRHKSASFSHYTKKSLEYIQKLNISWCKCIAYKSGNFGGWVSENYLSLGRLLPWFYGTIDHIAVDPQYEAPTAPQKQWTKQDNYSWLSIRGLNTKGTAKEFGLRVQNYLEAEGGPPPLVPLQGGPVRAVQEMLFSLHCLVCNLMSWNTSTLHILNVERGIKIFLTYFECFDKTMREENATPRWITSYNFVCLLNLPTMLATFGPLHNYWEGGGMDEKIIQQIKPLWNRFCKLWQLHLVEMLLKKMAIDRFQLHRMGHSGKK